MGRTDHTGHVAGYAAVAASCSFGALGASLWGPCATAVILVILSLGLHEPVYARHERERRVGAQSMLLLTSVANAAVTAGVAYVAGILIAWVFGL